MTPREIAPVLLGLAQYFNHEIGEASFILYFDALADLDAEALNRAARRAAKELTWMPRAAELRRLAGEPSAPTEDDRIRRAWLTARQALLRYGSYVELDFADGLIAATIRQIGGRRRFHEAVGDGVDRFIKPDFLAAYKALLGEAPAPHLERPLLAPANTWSANKSVRVETIGAREEQRLAIPAKASKEWNG